jgi:SAM-dependent methyltransferase
MTQLPDSKYFEYFSSLFHGGTMTPYSEHTATEGWDYPEIERQRFEHHFLTDISYVENQRILDLGCHVGYMSYISKQLGAKHVHGVNIRDVPINIANFAFDQLGQKNYKFEVADIEDLNYLATLCKNKDTVILTEVLEHCRNPLPILNTISSSNVKNLIFASAIVSDSGPPVLEYRLERTQTNFTSAFEGQKEYTLACAPNLSWITTVLYHLDWKIEHFEVVVPFNRNYFSVPNLGIPPKVIKKVLVLARKFENKDELNAGGWKKPKTS